MRVIKDPYTKLNSDSVVALGCFDGVHAGHASVIGEAVRIARERGCLAAVWCFSEPPKNFYLKVPVPLICGAEEKARLVRTLGADVLITPDFDSVISAVTAEDFVKELLCECAGAVHLVCGRDYTFGAGGSGNTVELRRICDELSVGLSVIEDVTVEGAGVSSSLVREAVSSGQCVYAAKLLGRDFSMVFSNEESLDGEDCRRLFLPAKYLSVPSGKYNVSVSYSGYRKKCAATVEKTDEGTFVTLDTPIACGGRVRVTFSDNRISEPRKRDSVDCT